MTVNFTTDAQLSVALNAVVFDHTDWDVPKNLSMVAVDDYVDEDYQLVEALHAAHGTRAGVVFNPGAYTHTSVALRDAISACGLPVVETHLSNVHAREEFRHRSLLAGVCLGVVAGFGWRSYTVALDGLLAHLDAVAS